MAYPQPVLEALASQPCPNCGGELRPAYVVSVHMRLVVNPEARTGLCSSVCFCCPCDRHGVFDMHLDRHELDAMIRELRLRGNAPPSRREPQQMFLYGAPVKPRHTATPSNRTAPDHPITDEEVAKFRDELDWLDAEVGSSAIASILHDFVRLYKPPTQAQEG